MSKIQLSKNFIRSTCKLALNEDLYPSGDITTNLLNNNLISKMLAKEALRLLGESIEIAVSNGSDLEARSNMLLGSMLAGSSFGNSPVAGVHALAYPIGGTYHIPHGLWL